MSPASELALAPLSPLGMSASGLSSGLGVGGLGVGGAGMGGGLTVDVADAGLHAFSSVALAGGGVAGGGDSSLFSDLVSAMGAEASGAYGGAVPVSAAVPLHAPGGAAQQGEASLSPLGVTHLPGMPPAFPTPYGSALATAPGDGPILQLAELAAAESWTVMSSQGNMHVSWRQRGGRLLWRAVAEGVPAMPAMVAAAVRHTLGQWGEADGVIGQVRVLSEGGGVPWWVSDCGPCFEQVLHATTRHDSGLSKFFQQRDLVFRSVWSITDGTHTCRMRPTIDAAAPEVSGVMRVPLNVDVAVVPDPTEPNGSSMYVLIDPGAANAHFVSYNHRQLITWMRRTHETAAVLQAYAGNATTTGGQAHAEAEANAAEPN